MTGAVSRLAIVETHGQRVVADDHGVGHLVSRGKRAVVAGRCEQLRANGEARWGFNVLRQLNADPCNCATLEKPSLTDGKVAVVHDVGDCVNEPFAILVDLVAILEDAKHALVIRANDELAVILQDIVEALSGRDTNECWCLYCLPVEQTAIHIGNGDCANVVIAFRALLRCFVVPCVSTAFSESNQSVLIEPFQCFL